MRVRPAQAADLDAIVELTRAGRSQLAAWSPVYFRPRDGADEAHAGFLAFIIGSDDHRTNTIVEDGNVIGFFQLVRQPTHWWLDDLSLDDRYRWADVVDPICEASTERPWVTCVSAFDDDRAEALGGAGLAVTSSYWTRPLTVEDIGEHAADGIGQTEGEWPRHTFGGMPFDPGLPGALVVGDADGNFATGSPSVEPPIYDPGGPTSVIDRLGGADRGRALVLAIGASAARFDAQLVVVARAEDHKLAALLSEHGFGKQVDVFLRE